MTASRAFAAEFHLNVAESERSFAIGRARFNVLFPLSSLSIVLCYAASWFKFGRDRGHRALVPLFSVPHSCEPAYIGYIKKLRFDPGLFLADLLDLAVRGFVVLSVRDNTLSVSRTAKKPGELSAPQRATMKKLFEGNRPSVLLCGKDGGSGPDVRFTQKTISVLSSSYAAGKAKTPKRGSKRPALASLNAKPILLGLLLFIPQILLLSSVSGDTSTEALAPFFTMAALAPFLVIVVRTAKKLINRRGEQMTDARSARFTRGLPGLIINFVSLAVILACIAFLISLFFFTLFGEAIFADPFALACIGTSVASAAVFSALMPSRTREGRKLLYQVECFEMFLRTAKKLRTDTLYPYRGQRIPELSPELFERLLPYSFALDAEDAWADAFAEILTEHGYKPVWCGGDSFDAHAFVRSMRSVCDAMKSVSGGR
jgi:hypothetical protein